MNRNSRVGAARQRRGSALFTPAAGIASHLASRGDEAPPHHSRYSMERQNLHFSLLGDAPREPPARGSYSRAEGDAAREPGREPGPASARELLGKAVASAPRSLSARRRFSSCELAVRRFMREPPPPHGYTMSDSQGKVEIKTCKFPRWIAAERGAAIHHRTFW